MNGEASIDAFDMKFSKFLKYFSLGIRIRKAAGYELSSIW